MRPTILLLNDTSRDPHWGCRATSGILRRLLAEKYPHAEVRPISMEPIHHAPGPLRRLLVAHAAATLVPDGSPSRLGPLLERWMERRLYGRLSPSQIERVVLNGEGSTHSFRGQSLRVLLPMYLASERHGIWTAAVNQTVQSRDERGRTLFRNAYERARYLAVREPRSLAEMRDLGLTEVQLSADSAFLLEPAPDAEVDAAMRQFGLEPGYVALSGSATIESYSPDVQRQIIQGLARRQGRPLAYLTAPKPDGRWLRRLGDVAPIVRIPASVSPAVILGMLSRASILITGRFHLMIFAALGGTPFVPLASNTFKIEGLLESLEYPVSVTGAQGTVEELEAQIEQVSRDREVLSDRLGAALPTMRERVLLNVAFERATADIGPRHAREEPPTGEAN